MPNWVQGKLEITGKNAEKVMQSLLSNENNEFGSFKFDFNKIKPMPKSLMVEVSTTSDKCANYYLSSISDLELAEITNKLLYINPKFIRGCDILSKEELEKIKEDYLASYSQKDPIFKDSPVFKTEKDIFNYGKQIVDNVLKYGDKDWYNWSINNWGTKWNACNTFYDKKVPNVVYFQTAWSDIRNLIETLSTQHPQNTFRYDYAEEQMGYYCGYAVFKNGKVLESCAYTDYSKEAYEQSFELWGEDESFVFDEKLGTYKYIDDQDDSGEEM